MASGSRFCRDALDVRAEVQQLVQCNPEEFRLRVMEKAGAISNVGLKGVCREECQFAVIGVEDQF